MEKIMTAAINVATTSERELSIDELDAVSGGYIFTDVMVESWSWGSANVGGYKTGAAEAYGNYKTSQAEGLGN
jgi:hypothetical protein